MLDMEDKNSFYVACTNNFNSLRVHLITYEKKAVSALAKYII